MNAIPMPLVTLLFMFKKYITENLIQQYQFTPLKKIPHQNKNYCFFFSLKIIMDYPADPLPFVSHIRNYRSVMLPLFFEQPSLYPAEKMILPFKHIHNVFHNQAKFRSLRIPPWIVQAAYSNYLEIMLLSLKLLDTQRKLVSLLDQLEKKYLLQNGMLSELISSIKLFTRFFFWLTGKQLTAGSEAKDLLEKSESQNVFFTLWEYICIRYHKYKRPQFTKDLGKLDGEIDDLCGEFWRIFSTAKKGLKRMTTLLDDWDEYVSEDEERWNGDLFRVINNAGSISLLDNTKKAVSLAFRRLGIKKYVFRI